jgi:predicted transcriptional regulator
MEHHDPTNIGTPVDTASDRCYSGGTLTLIQSTAMSTTSLKLSEELKQRAANAAQELGISPHAFMVDAIRRAAEQAEQRAGFVAQALAARAELLQSGAGIDKDAAHDYLRQRAAGGKAAAPGAASWRK